MNFVRQKVVSFLAATSAAIAQTFFPANALASGAALPLSPLGFEGLYVDMTLDDAKSFLKSRGYTFSQENRTSFVARLATRPSEHSTEYLVGNYGDGEGLNHLWVQKFWHPGDQTETAIEQLNSTVGAVQALRLNVGANPVFPDWKTHAIFCNSRAVITVLMEKVGAPNVRPLISVAHVGSDGGFKACSEVRESRAPTFITTYELRRLTRSYRPPAPTAEVQGSRQNYHLAQRCAILYQAMASAFGVAFPGSRTVSQYQGSFENSQQVARREAALLRIAEAQFLEDEKIALRERSRMLDEEDDLGKSVQLEQLESQCKKFEVARPSAAAEPAGRQQSPSGIQPGRPSIAMPSALSGSSADIDRYNAMQSCLVSIDSVLAIPVAAHDSAEDRAYLAKLQRARGPLVAGLSAAGKPVGLTVEQVQFDSMARFARRTVPKPDLNSVLRHKIGHVARLATCNNDGYVQGLY